MADQGTVSLSVRSELQKIIQQLEQISKASEGASNTFKKLGKNIGDEVGGETQKVETMLNRLRGVGGRVAQQIRDDFKSLVGINAIQQSLKLSNQFTGTVKDAFTLADTIRKLGTSFGMTGDQFSKFQTSLVAGLGDIGLSSDMAAKALEGLSGTQVKGEASLIGYAKAAGMLASLGREQGNAGAISGSMARVIQARGGNVNNSAERQGLMGEVGAAVQVTGKKASEILASMEQIFTGMDQQMRKRVSYKTLSELSVMGAMGGPGAMKGMEEYFKMSPIQRQAMEQQGFKGFTGKNGEINIEALNKFISEGKQRIGFDPRAALKTFGFSDEAAEGMVRLSENSKQAAEAIQKFEHTSRDTETAYKKSLGFTEAFGASINRVKGMFATAAEKYGMGSIAQGATGMLGKAATEDSGLGALGVVAGGAGLAAVLAGGGLRGIGKGLMGGMGGGLLKGAAAQAITGKEVQPVYVVNASEIGGGGIASAAGSVAGGAGGMIAKAGRALPLLGMAGLAVGAGAAAGAGASYLATQSESSMPEVIKKLNETLAQWMGMHSSPSGMPQQMTQKVIVEAAPKTFRTTTRPSRGGSSAPGGHG